MIEELEKEAEEKRLKEEEEEEKKAGAGNNFLNELLNSNDVDIEGEE